jgi:hypothetical protein
MTAVRRTTRRRAGRYGRIDVGTPGSQRKSPAAERYLTTAAE